MTQSTNQHWITPIKALVEAQLVPQVTEIDQQGIYPREFMQALGKLGGFAQAIPQQWGGVGAGLNEQIEVIAEISKTCGATAFVVWSQAVSAWYLLKTQNELAKQHFLPAITRGDWLCGTGMSNTIKHLAGIEKMHLSAEKQGDHYIVNGILPWVSNIDTDHLIIVSAQLADGYVMFVVHCNKQGVSLQQCPKFSGMEGSQTLNVRFHDVVVEAHEILAYPTQFAEYINSFRPGFILTQAALGFGIIEASIDTIQQTNRTHEHVNQYLDDQDDTLLAELEQLKQQTQALVAATENHTVLTLDLLRLRAKASELTLRAANSAALHAGARGYLMRHSAQRRVREAMFVAIVTPALKHLRKEIHALEQHAQVV